MANRLNWDEWSTVSEGVSAPGGDLTVVSSARRPGRFTLFLADPGGGVYTTSGNPRSGWNGWSTVSEGSTLPGARVGAVELMRAPGSFVVALADPGGGVYATFGSASDGWAPWSTASEGSTMPGAPVTAVENVTPDGYVSLFLADPAGGVYTASGIRNAWSIWTSVSEGRTIPGGPVTAVRIETGNGTARTRFAVFVTDPGGGVYTTSGNAVDGWAPWSEVAGIRFAPGAPVTAVPFGTRLDRFLLAVSHPDGSVRTTSGNAETGWLPWSSAPENRAVSKSRVALVKLPAVPGRYALAIVDSSGEVLASLGTPQGDWAPWSSASQGSSLSGAPIAANEEGTIVGGVSLFIADRAGGVYATTGGLARPAAPTNLRVTGVADRKISVAWADRSDNEDQFKVSFIGVRTGMEDHDGSKQVAQDATSADLTGLRSGYDYTISVIATNAAGGSSRSNEVRAATPSRQIGVSSEGAGQNSLFTIVGEGFTPNSLVVLRITDAQLQQLQFPETAGLDGKFSSRHAVRCVSGGKLTFTAFEDEDPLGTFANSIDTNCP